MRYLLIVIGLSFATVTAFGQSQSNVLSITAEGSVELPADIIQFHINLNAEADSPKEAYKLHQRREEALVKLLDKYEIKEKHIHFQPISIFKDRDSGRYGNVEKTTYQTRQSVNLKLSDFKIYEKIQVGLIEEGFDNFSGNFFSTKTEQGQDEALKKAIQSARNKAELIAGETGQKLGKIVSIDYGHSQVKPYNESAVMLRGISSTDDLMKYQQYVTISTSITINFALLN